MMVTGLPIPFKASPLDGSLTKSTSKDSETIQPSSFGVILRAKEKQLQQEQEVNASSVAAALTAMQTSSMPTTTLNISLEDGINKPDIQLDPPSEVEKDQEPMTAETAVEETHVDSSLSVPALPPPSSKPTDDPQMPGVVDAARAQTLPIEESPSRPGSQPEIHAEKSVRQTTTQVKTSNVLAGTTQIAAESFTGTEMSGLLTNEVHPSISAGNVKNAIPSKGSAEGIREPRGHSMPPEFLASLAAKQPEKKTAEIEIVEPPINSSMTLTVDAHQDGTATTSVNSTNAAKLLTAELKTGKAKPVAENKTDDVDLSVSKTEVPGHGSGGVGKNEIPDTEASTAMSSRLSEPFVSAQPRPGNGNVLTQKVTPENRAAVPSTEHETAIQTPLVAPSRQATVLESKDAEFQATNPVSKTTASVIKGSRPVPDETESEDFKLKTPVSLPHHEKNFEISNKQASILFETKTETSAENPSSEILQSVDEINEKYHLPVETVVINEPASPSDARVSLRVNSDVDVEKAANESTLPVQERDVQIPRAENHTVTTQTGVNQEESIVETKKTEVQSGMPLTDGVKLQSYEAVASTRESHVSKVPAPETNSNNKTDKAPELPVTELAENLSENAPIRSEFVRPEMTVEKTKVEKHIDLSTPVTGNSQATIRLESASVDLGFVRDANINRKADAETTQPVVDTDLHDSISLKDVYFKESHQSVVNTTSTIVTDVDVTQPPLQEVEVRVNLMPGNNPRKSRDSESDVAHTVHTSFSNLTPTNTVQVAAKEQNGVFEKKVVEKSANPVKTILENIQSADHAVESLSDSISDAQIHDETKNGDPSTAFHAELPTASTVQAETNDLPGPTSVNAGNVTVDAKKRVNQNNKPVSVAETSQPGVERTVATEGSPELSGEPEIRKEKSPMNQQQETAVHSELSTTDSVSIHKEILQEKVGFETKVVTSQASTKMPMPEVFRPIVDARAATEIGVVDKDVEPLYRSRAQTNTLQTTVLQSGSNSQQLQTAISQKTISSEVKSVEPQVDTSEAIVEASKPELETAISAKPASSSSTEHETVSAGPQAATQAKVSSRNIPLNLATVESVSLNAGTVQERMNVDPEHVETHTDSLEVATESSQLSALTPTAKVASFSSADHDMESVNPQRIPATKVSLTNSSLDLAKSESESIWPGMEQRLRIDPKNIEGFISALENVVEASQPEPAISSNAKITSYPTMDQETDGFNSQTIAQAKPPLTNNDMDLAKAEVVEEVPLAITRPDLPNVSSFEGEVNIQRPVVHPQSIEKKVRVHALEVEAEQSVPDLSMNSSYTVIESESIRIPSGGQETTATIIKFDLPQVAPSQLETELEKQTIGPENVDEPVSMGKPTVTGSQVNLMSSANPESMTTANINVEPGNQTVIFVESAPEFNNDRTAVAHFSESMIDEVSLPMSSVADGGTPVVLRHDALTEVETRRKVLKADQLRSPEEILLPVEKQYKPNEMPEQTVITTNSLKEGVMTGSVEKGPLVQVDPHAVEIVEQVVHQLNGIIKSGLTSMHLQLNPEMLGAIDVDVIRDAQGVNVTFFAEQASTGKLLETQLSQLRQSLLDSGVQLSGLNIGQHSHSGQEGAFQHQNTNFAQTSQRETLPREVNTPESPRAERVAGQMSEIDYLI